VACRRAAHTAEDCSLSRTVDRSLRLSGPGIFCRKVWRLQSVTQHRIRRKLTPISTRHAPTTPSATMRS
jgi:hypothetical protein